MNSKSLLSLRENIEKLHFNEREASIILQAVAKPDVLNEKLCRNIVDVIGRKAVVEPRAGRVAAKVCDDIAKSENAATKDGREKYFRKVLLSDLQQTFRKHKNSGYRDKRSWIGFVNYLCGIFDVLQVNNMPLMTLVLPMYEVLGILSDANFADDEMAIQCLVVQLQYVGEELDRLNKQKMDELIEKLSNLLCSETTSQFSCLMLLEIIELRSGNWKLSPSAYRYYYEEPGK